MNIVPSLVKRKIIKTFFYLILLLINYSLFAQKTYRERIPNGFKSAGGIAYTEVSQDTVLISVSLPDGTFEGSQYFTVEDVYLVQDTVKFDGGLWYMYQGKWENYRYQMAVAKYKRIEKMNAYLNGGSTSSDLSHQALRAGNEFDPGGARYAGQYELPDVPVKEPLPNTSNIVKDWTIQIIKRKFPNYYVKYLKK